MVALFEVIGRTMKSWRCPSLPVARVYEPGSTGMVRASLTSMALGVTGVT